MKTFEEYNEEIKVESVLKLSLTGPVLASAQKLQKKISDPDSVLLSGKDLHITLASGPWWKKEKNKIQLPIPEPDFRMDFEDSIQKISQGNSTSWYVRIKQQKEMKQYVKDILGNVPNPDRVYHVSLANRTGKKGDSVAIVEFFTLGVNKPKMSDVQDYLNRLGGAVRLLTNKDLIKNIEHYFKTIKNLKLDRTGRKVLSFEGLETEVAPPGKEKMIKKLKKKFGADSDIPFKIAWSQHNKGK
ncbi:MAG: hypothetical protein QGH26_04530 [Candidatus Pacebacteria bacterium]|nr:hypothetical protein [Candidatus Paceibacterota bacterium]